MDISFHTMFLVIATVAMVTIAVSGQRTYMRSCECEYTENGKCAYTLLLPLTQNENEAVCPTSKPDGESATVSPEMENKVTMLQETLAELSENITNLGLWSGDHSRMLSQLQSKVMEHTDKLAEIEKKMDSMSNMTTSDEECEACSMLELQLQEQSDVIMNLSNVVNKLFTDIQMQFENLQSNSSQVQNAMIFIETLNDTIANMQQSLKDTLDNINMGLSSYNLCAQKGLIVSGDSLRIDDDAITASSEMANATSEMVRINREDTTAWCPSEEPNNEEEWIQFDLGLSQAVYGVVTKGRADYAQWVTSYKIQYSADSMDNMMTFTNVVGDDEIFQGNEDQNTAKTNMFWQPIMARYIRFVPLSSYAGRNKCLRADVIGCLDV